MTENDKPWEPAHSLQYPSELDESVKKIVTNLVGNIDAMKALEVKQQIKTLKETHKETNK